MGKYLVLSAKENEYIINEETIKTVKIQYFNPNGLSQDRLDKGFEIVERNVLPDGYNLKDFQELPGYYELDFRQKPGSKNKGTSRLVSIKFEKEANIKPHAFNQKAYLVLRAEKLDFASEKGEKIKGIKITYIDPSWKLEEDKEIGFPIMTNFTNEIAFDTFEKTPAYYELNFEEVRGKAGKATSTLKEAKFIGELQNPQSPAS